MVRLLYNQHHRGPIRFARLNDGVRNQLVDGIADEFPMAHIVVGAIAANWLGARLDLTRLPRPDGVPLERWLLTFPSYGFVLAVRPENVARVVATFSERSIAAADIGEFTDDHRVVIGDGESAQTIWDFTREPLMGYAPVEALA